MINFAIVTVRLSSGSVHEIYVEAGTVASAIELARIALRPWHNAPVIEKVVIRSKPAYVPSEPYGV